MKVLVLTLVTVATMSIGAYADTPRYRDMTPKGQYMPAEQLSDWCVGDLGQQNFCHGYLFGVYDSTDCKMKQETPDWEKLKTVYVKWLFVKGDDAYVSAYLSAKAAFKQKYGCE